MPNVSKQIGFECVIPPNGVWYYDTNIVIQTNHGPLLLAKVMAIVDGPNAGTIFHELVRKEELRYAIPMPLECSSE